MPENTTKATVFLHRGNKGGPMDLRIADTFSDSVAELTGKEQTVDFDWRLDSGPHHGRLSARNGMEPAGHSLHRRIGVPPKVSHRVRFEDGA